MNPGPELEALYRYSQADVRACGLNSESAHELYRDYIQFVRSAAPGAETLLDVGCGNGWTAYLFANSGYRTTGLDLNLTFFEPSQSDRLCFLEASSLELPFDAESFDVVAAYQMLEHIPEPAKALAEMLRVLKPGGICCIVGPNLISPLQSLRGMLFYSWRNRPIRRIVFRDAEMPKHPFGNTLPESFLNLMRNLWRVTRRLLASLPIFELRSPDLIPPFHADNDACYLCNPLDLKRFFELNGCRVIQNGKRGRVALTRNLAAGTWVAVRKPRRLP